MKIVIKQMNTNMFDTKSAARFINFQICICKQKTPKCFFFESLFGSKPNNPLNNFSTLTQDIEILS